MTTPVTLACAYCKRPTAHVRSGHSWRAKKSIQVYRCTECGTRKSTL